jgi:Ni,Fe-hydrogenase III large subunit/Ni,Fe-hydrogenase III component G
MSLRVAELNLEPVRLAAALPVWHAVVDRASWQAVALQVAAAHGRLVTLWGREEQRDGSRGMAVSAAYALTDGLLWIDLPLTGGAPDYPDVSRHFPFAARMQRASADLLGIQADPCDDRRRWLDHGAWAIDGFALRDGSRVDAGAAVPETDDYAFVRVEGDGVHEIPVGPVHAGIIEPGHFRFSIVGEKVLRLEERLGYVHKGIERRFSELAPLDAHRLAGRVSGDSTVAGAWAYCMALESALASPAPPRAQWLRAVMLERERVANHLGDLGALANDAALAFGLAQLSRLREDWQRLSMAAFGHRLMMDCVVPGGVSADVDTAMIVRLHSQCETVDAEVRTLRAIFDEHAGLQDRFIGTGRVLPELAAQLGLAGLAGRASGQGFDLRCDQPWAPYDRLQVTKAGSAAGDVAARVAVRFDETLESLRLIRALCTGLPGGDRRRAPAGWKAGAARYSWHSSSTRARSGAAMSTTPRGRTGPCSSTRSSATSFRISRSSTSPST